MKPKPHVGVCGPKVANNVNIRQKTHEHLPVDRWGSAPPAVFGCFDGQFLTGVVTAKDGGDSVQIVDACLLDTERSRNCCSSTATIHDDICMNDFGCALVCNCYGPVCVGRHLRAKKTSIDDCGIGAVQLLAQRGVESPTIHCHRVAVRTAHIGGASGTDPPNCGEGHRYKHLHLALPP
jgi:hypothetical protein